MNSSMWLRYQACPVVKRICSPSISRTITKTPTRTSTIRAGPPGVTNADRNVLFTTRDETIGNGCRSLANGKQTLGRAPGKPASAPGAPISRDRFARSLDDRFARCCGCLSVDHWTETRAATVRVRRDYHSLRHCVAQMPKDQRRSIYSLTYFFSFLIRVLSSSLASCRSALS